MSIFKIIEKSVSFGTLNHRDNFISFTVKAILYIIPAIILGHYTDTTVKTLKENKILGDKIIYYIILQTLFIIITFYLFLKLLGSYASEFLITITGSYFIVMFYGIQINYISMINTLLQ